jgi:hypothetical protein
MNRHTWSGIAGLSAVYCGVAILFADGHPDHKTVASIGGWIIGIGLFILIMELRKAGKP